MTDIAPPQLSLIESFRRQWYYLPNWVTYLRILGAALPAILLVLAPQNVGMRAWSTFAFVVVASTDGIDGWLARRYKLTSKWGAFIDPIADKLLVFVSLLGLCWVYFGGFSGWVLLAFTVLVTAREVMLAYQINRSRHDTMPPTRQGKWKMALQALTVALWFVPIPLGLAEWTWARDIRFMITVGAVVVTITSWVEYYRLYVEPGRPRSRRHPW